MNFFKSQDAARKNTRKLVTFFLLAIISLIIMTNVLVMVVFGYLEPERFSSMTAAQAWQESFDWQKFMLIGVAVLVVVVIGSLYKIISLSGGGARIAEMMDAELIVDATGDINKQKILNVVEEMAIASGTPVPPVYLLNEEGINAFAAGYSSSDAVIGITRGAIEQLSRDQLQGVVAHEFSHIFNGDMRLNIRLIGMLHGILLLGLIGYYLLRGSSRSRNSKNGGGIVFLGIGLMVIGYAGTFFGNLIKAAVSRQREYLADASAVQYTRNPDGIAGALKRIGGSSAGSVIENPNGSEISHAFFSQGIKSYLTGLFATHPPLDSRIRKIDPQWDGLFDTTETITQPVTQDEDAARQTDVKKSTAVLASIAAVMSSANISDQVGQTTHEHLEYAHQLISDLPAVLKDAVHEPFGARAVIYFLVLDKNDEIRKEQLQHLLASADPSVYSETIKLVNQVSDLAVEYRLPLVDMALPTLRQLSSKQYLLFKENLQALINIDSKISLFEWSVKKIVLHHLDAVFIKKHKTRSQRLSLKKAVESCAILLSLLVYSGKQQDISYQQAFGKANNVLNGLDIQLLPKNELSLDALNNALDVLAQLKPLEKPQLLKACAACITADQKITATEIEIFRAIADTLDCPMPPLLI